MSKCKTIKRLFPATLAWTLLVSATTIFFLFPCRRLHEEFHYTITVVQAIITFFVISNFFCTTFFDPGIIKRANPDEDKDDFAAPLYKEVIVKGTSIRMKWCATCQFYRPPRCSHCSVCDNCIETFDHHCPWVNNCIGRRNYRHFFFFLIFLTLHMVTIFIWCLLLVLHNKNTMHETPVVVAISLMVFISIVFIPIFGLTVFHIILVARGRTTNEQVTGKFQGAINPFSKGLFRNCLYTLCGPRYPGVRRTVAQKDVFDVMEPDTGVQVYMDNIPMDVQTNYTHKSDLNDIMLERLDRKDAQLHSMNSSHSREQLNKQMSPNQEIQNFPNEFDSAINGMKRPEGGRHVVTMHQTENGTKETTFIALNSAYSTTATNSSSNGSSSSSNGNNKSVADRGIFSYYNNKISASPSKSTSINEISSHFKSGRSPVKRNESQGPEGGMVIYYSPDAGVISNSKYSSESELQKFNSSTPTSHYQPHHHPYGDKQSQHDFAYDSRDKLLKKPMPFLKALEMSNKMEKSNLFTEQGKTTLTAKETDTNRQSQYEMNYEISV